MRTVTIKLGGKDFELTRSFEVLDKISAQVVDPLWLAEEGFRVQRAADEGRSIRPAYTLTFDDACRVLHIGNGGAVPMDKVKEAAFETGALVTREIAMMYLTSLVTAPNQADIAEKTNGTKGDGEKGE